MKPLEISLDLKAYQLALENTKYNAEGKAVVEQGDEWREETEWDGMFKQLKKESKPGSVVMEQLKEEIKLTRLGRMLYDDGKVEGERIGEERGESKILTLIQKMTADGALEAIPRLTTDAEFYQAMAEKYSVDI